MHHHQSHPVKAALISFFSSRTSRAAGGLGLALFVGLTCGALYRWHAINRQSDAQEYFITCTDEYESGYQNPQTWAQSAELFNRGTHTYAGTAWAPSFYAYEALAQAHNNSLSQAIDTMQKALQLASSKNPLYSLYALSHALMVLDSDRTDEHPQALTVLQTIAQKPHDNFNDMAHFYYGYYYWQKSDFIHAYEIWQDLVARHQGNRDNPSLWAQKADQFLQHVTIGSDYT